MRRFLASAWFPFLLCIVLGGMTVAAYAILKPTGEDVGNSQVVAAFKIAGWAAGPVIALLSLILIFVLNGLRRLLRIRKVSLLHPVIAILGIAPWLIFAWTVTGEPRFTPFARAAIDFVARPMLWGSLVACLLAILLSLPLLFSQKQEQPARSPAKKK
jgi:hypothetical protein